MGVIAVGAVGGALILDTVFEEPPQQTHPVALFGRVVSRLEREWPAPGLAGTLIALTLPLASALLAGALTTAALAVSPIGGLAIATLALFSASSLSRLCSAATTVIVQTDSGAAEPSDLEAPRQSVRALAGRDASQLSAGELRSASAESLAENLADGLVAPLLAFSIGVQLSLSVGVGAMVWVKCVNTLDSMYGYRDHPLGWASARLDDVVMWLPARVSAVMLAVAGSSVPSLQRAREWHAGPPSPNSGWPMATLAAVLETRLEKPGVYRLNPSATLPTTAQAHTGVRIVRRGGVLSFCLAGVFAW